MGVVNKKQQQIETQLKELNIDKGSISLILKAYEENNNNLSIDLRHRIQFYCEHISPFSYSTYHNLYFANNKKNLDFIGEIPEKLFKLTSNVSHENVSILSEFISNQLKNLKQSNNKYKNDVLSDIINVFDKALKINDIGEGQFQRDRQSQQELVFHVLNKLNQENISNSVVVADFFLSLNTYELNKRFIKRDSDTTDITFDYDRMNKYIQLYSQYDIQATKALDILDDLMMSSSPQTEEKLLFQFDDKNRSYIKDLNIFKDSSLVSYLKFGGLDFYKNLKDKNHDLNLNRYVASVLPILEVGHKRGNLSYIDIANSFGKDLKPFLCNFVQLDVGFPIESGKNKRSTYLQQLNKRIMAGIMVDSDKEVAIVLAEKNTKIKRNFYWDQTDETKKYKDEVEFFKKMFAKFDPVKENFDAISKSIIFYEQKVKKSNDINKTLQVSILKYLDNYNSEQSNNYSIEDALRITSEYNKVINKTDMAKKSLQDMEQSVQDIEKDHKNFESDLNFLKKLKKPK